MQSSSIQYTLDRMSRVTCAIGSSPSRALANRRNPGRFPLAIKMISNPSHAHLEPDYRIEANQLRPPQPEERKMSTLP
jgi:hypothetical protein